jgi:hypothetical protein
MTFYALNTPEASEDVLIPTLGVAHSTMKNVSQLEFIENYVLGSQFRINNPSVETQNISYYDTKMLKNDRVMPGNTFINWLKKKSIFNENFYRKKHEDPRLLLPDRYTRLSAPFMEPPRPHKQFPRGELQLDDATINLIKNIQIALKSNDPSNSLAQVYHSIIIYLYSSDSLSQDLEKLGRRYLNSTLDLVTGFVHCCTTTTTIQVARKLNLDPDESIVMDCGSGLPVLGIQLSALSKETICIDLKIVMTQIFRILETMIPTDHLLQDPISGIHLVSQDILTMTMDRLPPICCDLTHLICFIGVPDGKNTDRCH